MSATAWLIAAWLAIEVVFALINLWFLLVIPFTFRCGACSSTFETRGLLRGTWRVWKHTQRYPDCGSEP